MNNVQKRILRDAGLQAETRPRLAPLARAC